MTRIRRLLFAALLLSVAGTLVLSASIVLPWWGITIVDRDYDGDKETESDYLTLLNSDYYEDSQSSFYSISSAGGMLGIAVLIFVLISLVLSGLTIIFIFNLVLEKSNYRFTISTFLFIVILLTFLSPLAYALGLPTCYKEDARNYYAEYGTEFKDPVGDHPCNSFWGSSSDTSRDIEKTWGPDSGWYLSVFSSLLFTISLLLVYIDKRIVHKEKDTLFELERLSSTRGKRSIRDLTDEELDREFRKHRRGLGGRSNTIGRNKSFASGRNGLGTPRNHSLDKMSDEELEEMLARVRKGK